MKEKQTIAMTTSELVERLRRVDPSGEMEVRILTEAGPSRIVGEDQIAIMPEDTRGVWHPFVAILEE